MLGKRLSESRKAISLYDPAFFEIRAGLRERYINTRDFSVLGDLSKLPSLPTVFVHEPVKPEHTHLLDSDELPVLLVLFRMYITAVENCEFDVRYETVNDLRRMTEDSANQFGSDVIREQGLLVQEFARSSTTPFSPPVGYLDIERAALRARAFATVPIDDPAKSKSS